LIVGLIGLLMGVALFAIGCADIAAGIYNGGKAAIGETTCYAKNNCTTNRARCGRSSCNSNSGHSCACY